MNYIQAKSMTEGEFHIPVADVRKGDREEAKKMEKAANGNVSRFVPGKYGYGPFGPKKY